jgi:transcriptional regulator with XRE-family HTH domain
MKNLSKEQLEFAVSYLHRLTTQRDITQTQLARLSSTVTQGTISKIFTRAQEPTEEVLKNLFAAVGVNLAEILNDSEALGHEILGYFATPLTGLSRNAGAAVERVVSRVKALLSGEEFSEPPTKLYWPGDHTHPARDPEFTANQVYLIDRSRASAYDFIIVLCASPSYGVGQENEIATQAGLPAIRLLPPNVSRMMVGSFIQAIDVPCTGSINSGLDFDDAKMLSALREVRRRHFAHRALYKDLNGNGFGERLRKLIADRCGDYQRFAGDLGVSLSYLHTLMDEHITVSNPSVRLLKRMARLLCENVAYVICESQEAEPVWDESNRSWRAWIHGAPAVDAKIALALRDEWREQYRFEMARGIDVASFRRTKLSMTKADWDARYQQHMKDGGHVGGKRLFER